MQHPHGKGPGHPGGHPLGHPGGHPAGHPHAQAAPGGMPPLRLIAWEVTRACNLACK
ncbi:MAG TPA: radical SAM/SPASM domain-containing protein, partial [Desulfovibrio sp.]|nr:radical SAM/SPASM domain-containing protein [Desulfovibrio sp.]